MFTSQEMAEDLHILLISKGYHQVKLTVQYETNQTNPYWIWIRAYCSGNCDSLGKIDESMWSRTLSEAAEKSYGFVKSLSSANDRLQACKIAKLKETVEELNLDELVDPIWLTNFREMLEGMTSNLLENKS